jgi:hypothetical protein
MDANFIVEAPQKEGVFGPEVLLNSTSGQGCLRFSDGTIRGPMPEPPSTNAFLVWLGYPVLVVSEGVRDADVSGVAHELRKSVGGPSIPVVVTLGPLESGKGARALTDNPSARPRRDLARAQAFVLVQCSWDEGPRINVELDGEVYDFFVEFRESADGTFTPAVQ